MNAARAGGQHHGRGSHGLPAQRGAQLMRACLGACVGAKPPAMATGPQGEEHARHMPPTT